jgi:hypothetical protein
LAKDKFAIITPLAFCIAGFFKMFGALIGLILTYWSASLAFGGRGEFFSISSVYVFLP